MRSRTLSGFAVVLAIKDCAASFAYWPVGGETGFFEFTAKQEVEPLHTSDLVIPRAPFWGPHGVVIKEEI